MATATVWAATRVGTTGAQEPHGEWLVSSETWLLTPDDESAETVAPRYFEMDDGERVYEDGKLVDDETAEMVYAAINAAVSRG